MGRNVLATFRVMPEDVETDLEAIMAKIKGLGMGDLRDVQAKDIAFGLKEIIVLVVLPDEGGVVEQVEQKLSAIEGVSEAENTNITLV